VIPASPIFGFGPGQFGGGAAAALGNTRVYEQLGLPFGVFGTGGHIDNNWFSLWGETGTLGLLLYAWMFLILFRMAVRLFRESRDPSTRALAIGFAALLIAVTFNAFLSTILEIRTTAFYLWLYAGAVVLLAGRRGNEGAQERRGHG
jgi:O-antigen ligase